jgi:hypothetical protein
MEKDRPMSGQKPKNVDPLFQLFEHHLLTRSYEDSAAFTKEVAEQYLAYLDSTLAHVPIHVRQTITEDLEQEAHEMLVKKMYGCVRSTDYENYGKVIKMKGATQFCTFEFTPAPEKEESDTPKKD